VEDRREVMAEHSNHSEQNAPEQNAPERSTLEVLSALSYRAGELGLYLQEVAQGVSHLIGLDWSEIADSPTTEATGRLYP
jgi:hypothetical protein